MPADILSTTRARCQRRGSLEHPRPGGGKVVMKGLSAAAASFSPSIFWEW